MIVSCVAYRAQLGRLGSRWGWVLQIKFPCHSLTLTLRPEAGESEPSLGLSLSKPMSVQSVINYSSCWVITGMQMPGASSGVALLAAIGTLLMTDRASGRVRCLASGCIDPDIDIRQGITRTCGTMVQPDGLHVNNLCGPGYFCNDEKVCERAGLPGVGCQKSLQCLPGMTCENEICVVTRLPGDSCEGDADCSYHNGRCIGNRCAGLGTGDGCSTRDTPQRCEKVRDAVLVEVCRRGCHCFLF